MLFCKTPQGEGPGAEVLFPYLYTMRPTLTFLLIMAMATGISAQTGKWLKGYTGDISGEVLTYHSPHPEATTSLLVRNQDSTKYIEWFTEPVPEGESSQVHTFVWIFGIDVNERSYPYKLFLDDQYLLTFYNPRDTLVKRWVIEGLQGSSLEFNASLVDKYGDLMGYAFLTLPAELLSEGEKPRVKITATSSGDPCWYMTHRYAMNSALLARQMPALVNGPEGRQYLLRIDIHHFGEQDTAMITAGGQSKMIPVKMGVNYTYIPVDGQPGKVINDLSVTTGWVTSRLEDITLEEVEPMTLYLLHHSHTDIGYTHHQSLVEKMHHGFFREAVELWENTENYPEGARFKWNTEVTWAVESYLESCTPGEKEAFARTVREGGIGLDGLWANELTALCRPEELIQLLQRSAGVAEACGVELRSAMITDIPGYTWSLVPVMAKSGIRYFSAGTNVFHRIGDIKDVWGDRPFYWVSESGIDSVLTWFPERGYSWFHTGLGSGKPKNLLTEEPVFEYVQQLSDSAYPYDISIIRYNIGSDNGPPHSALPDIVKAWNEKYISPGLTIATTSEAFAAFEDKYGHVLPSFRGDLTPYWEDGAASSAKETALNRQAAERLEQALSLWVISGNKHYPTDDISQAWKNILLFDEHTWGSWNSISAPLDTFTLNQWETKRSFALEADRLSKQIMQKAIETLGPGKSENALAFDIWNTHSWPVTDIIFLPVPDGIGNAYATDVNDNRLKSQRMSDGTLAVMVSEVPPFAAKRVLLRAEDHARIDPEPWLLSPETQLSFNHESGDISALRHPLLHGSLADISMGYGLNAYIYVEGRDPKNKHTTTDAHISYPDRGKLVNTIRIESGAPGTKGLVREIMVMNGLGRIDIRNTIDKEAVYEPEGVHFAFPFNIPGGEVAIGQAFGYYHPGREQLPGSNHNYYTLNRWVDVSGNDEGVCMVSLDAPLVELGEISTDPIAYGWKDGQEQTQTVFSYVMNNYWETNFLAAQPGKAVFRYSLYPGTGFDPLKNEQRALERTQPLIVVPASGRKNLPPGLFTLGNPELMVTALVPGNDSRHFLIRIHNPGDAEESPDFRWNLFKPMKVSLSGLSGQDQESPGEKLSIPARGFETVRVDF